MILYHSCQCRNVCLLTVTRDLKCSCGFTVITFPCGDKNAPVAPPRCLKPCKILTNCHHPRRKAHRCHFEACPTCTFVCDQALQGCPHRCAFQCHDNVPVPLPEIKRAGPWEKVPEKRIEIVKQPCPPCPVPVPIECLGKHTSHAVACSRVAEWSCAVICGRTLECSNHVCETPCHAVQGVQEILDSELAGLNCQTCLRPCRFPRPDGCTHECSKQKCHSKGLCPPCNKIVRFRCHCKNMQKHLPCKEINGMVGDALESTKSCGGNCPKLISCGHSCNKTCHSGECSNSSDCRFKILVKCSCKRIKKETPCVDLQDGRSIPCDNRCKEVQEAKKAKDMEDKTIKEEEERIRQEKVKEEFEKRQNGPRRNRKNRSRGESENNSCEPWYGHLPSTKKCLIILCVVFGFGAVVVATIVGLQIDD
jgi:NF-X1-type zinc finger protein NFXL1